MSKDELAVGIIKAGYVDCVNELIKKAITMLASGTQTAAQVELQQLVIEQARAAGQPVKVAPDAIRATTTSSYPTPARRPLNSRLATARFERAFGLTLPHWQAGVERMLREVLGR